MSKAGAKYELPKVSSDGEKGAVVVEMRRVGTLVGMET